MDWLKIGFGAALGAVISVVLTLWLTDVFKPEPRPEVRVSWVTLPKETISTLMEQKNTTFTNRARGYDILITNGTNARTKPIEIVGQSTIYGIVNVTAGGTTTNLPKNTNWNSIKLAALGPGDSVRLFLVSESYDEVPFKVLNGDVIVAPTLATTPERPHRDADVFGIVFLLVMGTLTVGGAGVTIWVHRNKNNMSFLAKMTSASDLARYARLTDYLRKNAAEKLPDDLRKPPDDPAA